MKLFHLTEVHQLKGDYNKDKKIPGWKPAVSFKVLIQMIADSDLRALKQQMGNMLGQSDPGGPNRSN